MRYLILIVFLMSFLISVPAYAGVETVTLRIDGLACPFCAYGLEKKCKKLEGFQSLNVLIDDGKAIIKWKKDKPIRIAAIQKAVKKAGFTLRGITTIVVGQVFEEKGKFYLQLTGPSNQKFYVFNQNPQDKSLEHQEEGSEPSLTASVRKNLKKYMRSKQAIRIQGSLHNHPGDSMPVLRIDRMERVSSRSTAK